MGDILDKSLQEICLEALAQRFATLLGVDNIPIIWNANPKRTPKESGNVSNYPILYMNVVSVARNEHTPYKRVANTFQLGYVSGDGTRKAIQLTPIQVSLRFFLKTDNHRQALNWSTDLIVDANTHSANAQLSFVIRSDALGKEFALSNQAIITSSEYPITEVEQSEEVMEYSIEGEIMFYTRASKGKLEAQLIPTFGILPQTDPDHAVQNVDGTTSPLVRSADGRRKYPVRMRSNLD